MEVIINDDNALSPEILQIPTPLLTLNTTTTAAATAAAASVQMPSVPTGNKRARLAEVSQQNPTVVSAGFSMPSKVKTSAASKRNLNQPARSAANRPSAAATSTGRPGRTAAGSTAAGSSSNLDDPEDDGTPDWLTAISKAEYFRCKQATLVVYACARKLDSLAHLTTQDTSGYPTQLRLRSIELQVPGLQTPIKASEADENIRLLTSQIEQASLLLLRQRLQQTMQDKKSFIGQAANRFRTEATVQRDELLKQSLVFDAESAEIARLRDQIDQQIQLQLQDLQSRLVQVDHQCSLRLRTARQQSVLAQQRARQTELLRETRNPELTLREIANLQVKPLRQQISQLSNTVTQLVQRCTLQTGTVMAQRKNGVLLAQRRTRLKPSASPAPNLRRSRTADVRASRQRPSGDTDRKPSRRSTGQTSRRNATRTRNKLRPSENIRTEPEKTGSGNSGRKNGRQIRRQANASDTSRIRTNAH